MPQAEQRERTAKRIALLHGSVRPLAYAIVGYGHLTGVDILITGTLRTFSQQNDLYAQGRTAHGRKVTNAEGGQSYHNYGLAFDFVVMDYFGRPLWTETPWKTIGEFGESIGLAWGGNWTKPDRPHFQLAGVPHHTALLAIAPDGYLPADWRTVP